VAVAPNGLAAVQQGLARRPDIVFLDVRMPGQSGLEPAQALAEEWPGDTLLPLTVFVTAYDEYALKAFDLAAVDYVLKPVRADRLALTCSRLKDALAHRHAGEAGHDDATLVQSRALLAGVGAAPAAKLTVIQASEGNTIHMVRIDDVLYFEAADKYVRLVTVEREHLIRMSLRELPPQLDTQRFWQVHRGTVVRADAIATATRDEAGKLTLSLRGHADRLPVSRLYSHLFKAMSHRPGQVLPLQRP
jgi:DNA-binding LytR/AlgR family response regulator